MKKSLMKTTLLILLMLVILTSCDPPQVKTSEYLKVGDFLEFGRYKGEDILWQIIKKDESNILLISQYILCYKPFDANGDLSENRGGKERIDSGSNYWAKSNLHDWLNSDSRKVVYSQQAPDKNHVEEGYNNYENESGFLYEFNQQEEAVIRPYSIKTALADADRDVKSEGTSLMNTLSSDIGSFTGMDAYSQTDGEKVFILSAEEINTLLKEKGISLDTIPTSFAEANSDKAISNTGKGSYWVRTPDALTADKVCYIESSQVSKAKAYSYYIGVRPAVCIDTGIFKSGSITQNGTMQSPYKLISASSSPNTDKDFDICRDGYGFGNSSESFGYENGYKIPIERYIQVFGDPENPIPEDIINKISNVSPWGGSCLGMAVTAKLFNIGFIKYSDFRKDVTCTHDFSMPGTKDSLITEIIEQYQIYQGFGQEVIDEYRNSPKDASGVLNKAMNAGPAVIEVRGDYYGPTGHALLPYKFEKQSENIYKIYVYDCNDPYPGPESQNRVLTIDKSRNIWEYKLFPDEDILWGSGKKYSEIYCRRISAFLSRPTPSWHSNIRNESNLYISGANSVVIKSESGYAEYSNGELVTNIEGAYLIPYTAVSKDKRNEFSTKQFLLPSDEYVVTASDKNKSLKTNDIVFMGNDRILSIKKGNNATPVTINPEKGSIRLKSDSKQDIDITLYGKKIDNKSIGYSVTGQIIKNTDVNISMDNDGSIKVLSDKSIDLKVTQSYRKIIKNYDLKILPNITRRIQ